MFQITAFEQSKIIKQQRWRRFIEGKANAMIQTRSKPIHEDKRRVRKESCPLDAELTITKDGRRTSATIYAPLYK